MPNARFKPRTLVWIRTQKSSKKPLSSHHPSVFGCTTSNLCFYYFLYESKFELKSMHVFASYMGGPQIFYDFKWTAHVILISKPNLTFLDYWRIFLKSQVNAMGTGKHSIFAIIRKNCTKLITNVS